MSYREFLEKRLVDRLSLCRESGSRIVRAMHDAGVHSVIFGSTARGDVHTESDIDVLVVEHGNVSRAQVLRLAESVTAVPVDVVFAEDVRPEVLQGMLKESRHAD